MMILKLILVNARRETRDARRETRDAHNLNFSVFSNSYYVYSLNIYLLNWIFSLIRDFYIFISKFPKSAISVLYLSAFYKNQYYMEVFNYENC